MERLQREKVRCQNGSELRERGGYSKRREAAKKRRVPPPAAPAFVATETRQHELDAVSVVTPAVKSHSPLNVLISHEWW